MLPKSEKTLSKQLLLIQVVKYDMSADVWGCSELQYLVWTEGYSPAGLNDVWCHMTFH